MQMAYNQVVNVRETRWLGRCCEGNNYATRDLEACVQ